MIWFVDLTESPLMPIVHRCVRSSAPEVSAINTRNQQRNHNRIIPDDTDAQSSARSAPRSASAGIRSGQRTRSLKQPPLRVGGSDALARDVEVTLLDFDADELAAEIGAGDSGGAGTHERVGNCATAEPVD